MGSKTTTKNTHGYVAPPNTADRTAQRAAIGTAYDTPDATIPFSYNRQRSAVKNRFTNPFGHGYSGEAKDAIMSNDINQLDQQQGLALRQDQMQRNQAKVGALAHLADGTAPQLIQTGGTQTQSAGGAIAGMVGSIGSAALM